MQNAFFQRNYGIDYTYKLFGMVGNTPLPGVGISKRISLREQLVENLFLMPIIKTKKAALKAAFLFCLFD